MGWLPGRGGGPRREARLWTRRRQDAARYFPELAAASGWIEAREAIVDGEVVALDEAGPAALQPPPGPDRDPHRAQRRAAKRRGTPAPIVYQAFDLLHLDGRRCSRSRSRSGSACSTAACARIRWSATPAMSRPMAIAFFEAARQQELEGIVAKLRRSPYEPDRRSKAWLKLKVRREQEVVVVGWLPGQGTHVDLGSLILAVRSGDRWVHAGQVGSGIDARDPARRCARSSRRSSAPTRPWTRRRG